MLFGLTNLLHEAKVVHSKKQSSREGWSFPSKQLWIARQLTLTLL